jgi:hypothetical protein
MYICQVKYKIISLKNGRVSPELLAGYYWNTDPSLKLIQASIFYE